tara:strand:- start:242 stop:355 length:114 start_codon:yes stop_codon:yes gene_type:complete
MMVLRLSPTDKPVGIVLFFLITIKNPEVGFGVVGSKR